MMISHLKGERHGTNVNLERKVKKMAKAISRIGLDDSEIPPILVGIAEVENKNVINALLGSKTLRNEDYYYVHFDSPDERGIDTALIYHREHFEVLDAEIIPLMIEDEDG